MFVNREQIPSWLLLFEVDSL